MAATCGLCVSFCPDDIGARIQMDILPQIFNAFSPNPVIFALFEFILQLLK